MKNISFRKRINFGFGTVFILMLITSLYAIWQLNTVSRNMELVFEHPYKVSNSIRQIQIEIYKVVRLVRDIRLTENNKLGSLAFELNKSNIIIKSDLNLVKTKYLGNMADVDSVVSSISGWQVYINKMYWLKRENKADSLDLMIKYDNHEHVDKIIFYSKKYQILL